MKNFLVLLALAGSLLGCASSEMPAHLYGEPQRSALGNFCPPTQAIRGIC
jgi:hypothetical protein